MKIRQAILMFVMILMASGCYAEMTGIVVDAETGQPIEGAVVLVEWTITKGIPGLQSTEIFKTIELLSDKDGKFKLTDVVEPGINKIPHVVIYKKGYVAWNNQYIFPKWDRRKDFKLKDGMNIELERFNNYYSSHYDHVSFIASAAVSGSGGKLLEDAYMWERILADLEKEKRKKNNVEGR
jgi:hypothetical protein